MMSTFHPVLLLAIVSFSTSFPPISPSTRSLDKTGTRALKKESRDPQILDSKAVANRGSLEAERKGFEPLVRLPAHGISSAAPSAARSPLQNVLNRN